MARSMNDLLSEHRYSISKNIFFFFLHSVYLVAFSSLYSQLPGLAGCDGILPVESYLRRLAHHLCHIDCNSMTTLFFNFPTLIWYFVDDSLPQNSTLGPLFAPLEGFSLTTDGGLDLICLIGMMAAIAGLILPVAWRNSVAILFLEWIAYLSLLLAGSEVFLSFQWDILLVEVGFVSIWLGDFLPRFSDTPDDTRMPVVWILRFIVFKMMLMSGIVKIQSRCPTWEHLTALQYHYATQCIPTPLAWWAYQLPDIFHLWGVATMFIIELIAPFLLLVPIETLQRLSASLQITLQLSIIATGNYTYFNFLTIGLCMLFFNNSFFFGRFKKKIIPFPVRSFKANILSMSKYTAFLILSFLALFNFETRELVGSIHPNAAAFLEYYFPVAPSQATTSFLSDAVHWLVVHLSAGVRQIEVYRPILKFTQLIQFFHWGLILFAVVLIVSISFFVFHNFSQFNKRPTLYGKLRWLVDGLVASFVVITVVLFVATANIQSFQSVQYSVPQTAFDTVYPGSYDLFQTELKKVSEISQKWKISNSYGLFAQMTGVDYRSTRDNALVARPEIVFELSHDGKTWSELHFPFKITGINESLSFVAPHQPRLDWQLWFAALSPPRNVHPWFVHLIYKILKGHNAVTSLIHSSDLLKGPPPTFLKTSIYFYNFTTFVQLTADDGKSVANQIWNRQLLDSHTGALSLDFDFADFFESRHLDVNVKESCRPHPDDDRFNHYDRLLASIRRMLYSTNDRYLNPDASYTEPRTSPLFLAVVTILFLSLLSRLFSIEID